MLTSYYQLQKPFGSNCRVTNAEMESTSVSLRKKSKSGPEPVDDASPVRTPPTSTGGRKKMTGIRAWMLVDRTGQSRVLEAGKHFIMRKTGLSARDIRILDPPLSYPSTILGRERAIVINLDHIRAIITAQDVLLLNSRDPSVTPFLKELQRRLGHHHQATRAQGANPDGSDAVNWHEVEKLHSRADSSESTPKVFSELKDQDESPKVEGELDVENQDGSKVLPFEFVALEACLEDACNCLEGQATTLEQEANSALAKLTSKINTLTLERVRQLKSRLVTITGRVQKVRDELEHLLDDDEDMAQMYLTEKLAQQHLENSSASSIDDNDDIVYESPKSDMEEGRPAEISLKAEGLPPINEGGLRDPDNSHENQTSAARSSVEKILDVKELEMLLEPYFVQVDGILNKLCTLREYIDDTEDYINITLDDKQNQLLQMGVMLSTATLALSIFIVLAGIMGMNIRIPLFDDQVHGMHNFLWTCGGGATGVILLYLSSLAWYKHKRLLER